MSKWETSLRNLFDVTHYKENKEPSTLIIKKGHFDACMCILCDMPRTCNIQGIIECFLPHDEFKDASSTIKCHKAPPYY